MHYRPFGRLDFQVSALGFGAMRLPEKDRRIDEKEAARMLHYAVDRGCNYVDTAWPYHGGQSEEFLGRALQDGYRQKVKLATKLPSWAVKSAADFDQFLDAQLKRLRTDALDFYLLHALDRKTWTKLRGLEVLDWAEKARQAGKFRYFGFSFHDDFDAFQPIIDAYDWDMCQIQYNFMDVENQAGTKGLRYAAAKKIAVVIMEPLLGGRISNPTPPPAIQAVWEGSPVKRTPAGWALGWLWDQPEVACVLSGMSTMAQVEENTALAAACGPGSFTAPERELVDKARAAYQRLIIVPCTACRYCLPCPHDVDIPANLRCYNEGTMYGNPAAARGEYSWWKYAFEVQHNLDHDIRAVNCVQCGDCEAKCPQSIPISKWMKVVHKALGENGPFVSSPE